MAGMPTTVGEASTVYLNNTHGKNLRSFGPEASMEALQRCLDEDGGLILLDAVSEADCDQVISELGPYVEATAVAQSDFAGFNTQRTGAVVARSPSSVAMWAHPKVLALCKYALGQQKLRGRDPKKAVSGLSALTGGLKYQLSMTQIMKINPGETAQFVHADKGHYTYPLPNDLEPEMATMWALSDFTAQNGGTLVIPGSHLWDGQKQKDFYGGNALTASKELKMSHFKQVAPTIMPKGSCLVYGSSTYHAGGDNISNAPRWGLRLAYNLAFLRQEENQYISCPAEVARRLPEELQALIGYDSLGALGYVADAHHPMSVLQAGWGTEGGWDAQEPSSARRLKPTKLMVRRYSQFAKLLEQMGVGTKPKSRI
jgi:hypothetical protein